MSHQKAPVVRTLEALESRIAPAVVFLAGTDAFRNEMSVLVPDSAAQFGVDGAFLLKAGDSLVMDVNHDGRFKASDDLLVAKVRKGRALLFFDDRDGVAGFSSNEITGAMVSSGFVGEIQGDVHGSVVAGLTSRGDVGWDSVASSIAGLTVAGTVFGNVLADGAIKNVTIKSAGNDSFASAQNILSGAAAGGLFTFGGTTEFFSSAATAKSPSEIFNITLARGTGSIVSGSGLNGGDIFKVVIGRQLSDLIIRSGDSQELSGGNGGSLCDIEIHGASNDINLAIYAGWGTMRKTRAGAGGSIDSLSILAEGARLGAVDIAAGNGGNGASFGDDFALHARGGKGGDVTGLTLLAGSATSTLVLGGNGGAGGYFHREAEVDTRQKTFRSRDGFGNLVEDTVYYNVVIRPEITRGGRGGDGGEIADVQIHAETPLEMRAGEGGQSFLRSAGDAGSILDVETRGLLRAYVFAGVAASGRFGGNGGSIAGFSASDLAADAQLLLEAGNSGAGFKRAGIAGDISGVFISSEEVLSQVAISAGSGVNAEDYDPDSIANGTDGGNVSDINIDVKSAFEIYVSSGIGGNGGYHAKEIGNPAYGLVLQRGGSGGNGGDVDGVTIHSEKLVDNLLIASGPGGHGRVGRSAGSGGNISQVEIANYSNGEIRTGAGGISTAGRSGDGGCLSHLSFSGGSSWSTFGVSTGDGGDGGSEGGSGGNGGDIAHISGRDVLAGLSISSGKGGSGTDYVVEPQFVEVDKPRLVPDGFGGWVIEFVTKTIKVADRIARAGAGGDGGSVSHITWDAALGAEAALSISTGIGGDGASASAIFERVVKVPDPFGGYYEDYQTYTKVFARRASGEGGDVRDINMRAEENTQIALVVEAGNGGNGINYAAPARGGSIAGMRVHALGFVSWVSLNAGDGGSVNELNARGAGGTGGSIKNVHVRASELGGTSVLWAGDGGTGARRAGAGGDVANVSLIAPNDFEFECIPGSGEPAGTLTNVFPRA